MPASLTAPTAGASTTVRAPASRATSSASFRSAHGSAMTTRTCSSFICRIRAARWPGDGGIPGRSSIAAAWTRPKRWRKYSQVSWYVTTRVPRNGREGLAPAGQPRVQAARKSPRGGLEGRAVLGRHAARPSTMWAVTAGAVPGSRVKCGLPSGWTSPFERSTRPAGTPRTGSRRTRRRARGPPAGPGGCSRPAPGARPTGRRRPRSAPAGRRAGASP